MTDVVRSTRAIDPRAIRVAVRPALPNLEAIVLEPAAIPVVPPRPPALGDTIGGTEPGSTLLAERLGAEPGVPGGLVLVDGAPVSVRLERRDPTHAVLVEGDGPESTRAPIVMLEPGEGPGGTVRREVIVDGWRIVVEIELERRASLRERAQRGRDPEARSGRSELRAVIPGRILSVAITPGDRVSAGQQVMVVEAMKMQNELRASRDGVVARVEVGPGQTVEVGDLLLVLE